MSTIVMTPNDLGDLDRLRHWLGEYEHLERFSGRFGVVLSRCYSIGRDAARSVVIDADVTLDDGRRAREALVTLGQTSTGDRLVFDAVDQLTGQLPVNVSLTVTQVLLAIRPFYARHRLRESTAVLAFDPDGGAEVEVFVRWARESAASLVNVAIGFRQARLTVGDQGHGHDG